MPTQLGFDVTKILSEYFSDIVDAQFTAQMEDNLDSVELQKLPWKNTIDGFYGNFRKELDRADAEVERIEQEVVLSDEVCELCGKPMAIKEGRLSGMHQHQSHRDSNRREMSEMRKGNRAEALSEGPDFLRLQRLSGLRRGILEQADRPDLSEMRFPADGKHHEKISVQVFQQRMRLQRRIILGV